MSMLALVYYNKVSDNESKLLFIDCNGKNGLCWKVKTPIKFLKVIALSDPNAQRGASRVMVHYAHRTFIVLVYGSDVFDK